MSQKKSKHSLNMLTKILYDDQISANKEDLVMIHTQKNLNNPYMAQRTCSKMSFGGDKKQLLQNQSYDMTEKMQMR